MENVSVVVDAKYKRHWEELQEGRWSSRSDDIREQHRADILQVLAYANLASARDMEDGASDYG